jgi:hypothetical protein
MSLAALGCQRDISRRINDAVDSLDVDIVVLEVSTVSTALPLVAQIPPHLVSQSRPTRLYTVSECLTHSWIWSAFLASHSWWVSRRSPQRKM